MASFDEKKGVIVRKTEWGGWSQTVDEVQIEVECPESTSGKEVTCSITPTSISLSVKGHTLFKEVNWKDDEWSLEDRKTIRVMLLKASPGADNCWTSLLKEGESYPADAWTLDQMQKSLTLERFQNEVDRGIRSLDHDDDLDDDD